VAGLLTGAFFLGFVFEAGFAEARVFDVGFADVAFADAAFADVGFAELGFTAFAVRLRTTMAFLLFPDDDRPRAAGRGRFPLARAAGEPGERRRGRLALAMAHVLTV
jgi:hypothetical protein